MRFATIRIPIGKRVTFREARQSGLLLWPGSGGCIICWFMPAKPFYIEDWWPVVAVTLVALIAFILAVIALLRSRAGGRRGGWHRIRQAGFSLLSLASFAVFGLGSLLILQFRDYHTLTEWEVVGRVKCGPQEKSRMFPLHLTLLANGKDRATHVLDVYGDRWKIGADVIEWKPFMRHLGLTRSFRLARLDGIYHREQDYLERPVTIRRLGAGSDKVWVRLHGGNRPWPYRCFVRSAYTTTISMAPDTDTAYDVVSQKLGLGLRKVDY